MNIALDETSNDTIDEFSDIDPYFWYFSYDNQSEYSTYFLPFIPGY